MIGAADFGEAAGAVDQLAAHVEALTKQVAELLEVGIPRKKLFPLRQDAMPKRTRSVAVRARAANGKHG